MTTGLQSAGQIVITTSTALSATQAGYNILTIGSGITLTFPSIVATYAISNIGSSPISLVYPTGSDFGPTLYPGQKVLLAGDGGGFWRVVVQSILNGFTAPQNDWPDPQFCIQDANNQVPAMNDTLTGTISPVSFSSNTTGSTTVTCFTSNTGLLQANNLIYFDGTADPALVANGIYRVTAVNTNVSFTVVGEAYWSVPTTSVASSAHVMQRGISGAGSGNVTSNVQRGVTSSGGSSIWISERAAHTSLLVGCKRVLVVQLASTSDRIFWQPSASRLAAMQGTNRAVGMAVYIASGSGAQAQAFINNGSIVLGGPVATGASRTWVSTSGVVSANIYQAGIQLSGPVGSVFVIGEFTECASLGSLPDNSFSTPRGQIVRSLASISPWVGQTVTVPAGGSFVVDFKQISAGVLNEGVSYLMGLLEGQSTISGDVLSPQSQSSPPITYNPILHQINTGTDGSPNFYGFCGGNFNIDDNARMAFTGTASHTWRHLSWDIHGANLFVGP